MIENGEIKIDMNNIKQLIGQSTELSSKKEI